MTWKGPCKGVECQIFFQGVNITPKGQQIKAVKVSKSKMEGRVADVMTHSVNIRLIKEVQKIVKSGKNRWWIFIFNAKHCLAPDVEVKFEGC